MSNRQNCCNTNLVVASPWPFQSCKTFITDRGRPYTDTPFVIPSGILKSSQPIGDDPNLCIALNLNEFNI